MRELGIKELLTEAEQRWREALDARRKAAEADSKYRQALKKWYEEQNQLLNKS